ncbi:MAG: hypothetical protein ICV75_06730 [Nitrospiraceae bacterium]|nr:hypothetical protein [Nitrospiraceae bacterium]
MTPPITLADEDLTLLTDAHYFRKKAAITVKLRRMLEATEKALQQDLAALSLIVPPGFDPASRQLVKGEHLEECPYQYLDCPKHFDGVNKFTFRTLVWWGHHAVCALLLEGTELKQYKRRIVDRYHQLAGHDLELSLAPTLWEWKRGEGYTLPITHDRKAQIAAVLAERPFLKILRCIPLNDARLQAGHLPEFSSETFHAIVPIVTP